MRSTALTLLVLFVLSHKAIGFPRSFLSLDFLIAHERRKIARTSLAKESIQLPNSIPLLFGNSIQGYKKVGSRYDIVFSKKHRLQVFSWPLRFRNRYVGAFVFKKSTMPLFPVPMENSIVLIKLRPHSNNVATLYMWFISHGIYSRLQRRRQHLFAQSLIRDFADNAQRVLGVRNCGSLPTVSGLCNNKRILHSGVTFHNVLEPIRISRPSTKVYMSLKPKPRFISNQLMKKEVQVSTRNSVNLLMVYFGQFIDHEVTLTPSERIDKDAQAPIDNGKMKFSRSGILRYNYEKCCGSPYLKDRVWQRPPFNVLTSFIDGGSIYGSDNLRAIALRSFTGGELIVQSNKGEVLLPFNRPDHLLFRLPNEPSADDKNLFVGGDIRANENAILTAIHTVFVREHNRVCRMLRKWLRRKRRFRLIRDVWLYKMAKLIVTAELQSITFHEFIPAMVGPKAFPEYKGYKASKDARISIFHSGFAFRWGHSAVSEHIMIRDRNKGTTNRSLREMFFNTSFFLEYGADNLLLSAIETAAEEVDEQIVDSLRNFLFNPPKRGRLDLAAMNIQRTRDQGIPSYLKLQQLYRTGEGLENIKPKLREPLMKIYGSAAKIDALVGGLCEKPLKGSILGPLYAAINIDQFLRIRDGDRFYYQNIKWHPAIIGMPLIQKIRRKKIRLRHIILANTGLRKSDFPAQNSLFRFRKQDFDL